MDTYKISSPYHSLVIFWLSKQQGRHLCKMGM